jgi:hypothetical protein
MERARRRHCGTQHQETALLRRRLALATGAVMCVQRRSQGRSSMSAADATGRPSKQLLHLVFGGELKSLDSLDFANIEALDIIGIFPNYAEAHKAWKAAAQRSVDNAHMRYFIVHMHRLLDPDTAKPKPRA